MKLAPDAVVETAKIRDYLLDAAHPQNKGKAALFLGFGFTRANWPVLASALERHAVDNLIVKTSRSPHGMKYVVTCNLISPDGRNPCLTSVWVIDADSKAPRLVTAYGGG